jgi:hypothetical protein
VLLVDQTKERALIDSLIEDINSNFMCNLSPEYSTSRDGTAAACTDTTDAIRIILIGASHAGRLAGALRETGAEIADLSVLGWKISDENVESSIALLCEVLEEDWEGETVVLYQLFDNSCYYSIGTDGSAALPTKSSTDNRYHIIGALGMVDRDTFKQLFSAVVPLLRAGGQNKKVILSPLMRYAIESCCDSAGHCVNHGPALNKVLSEGLDSLHTWIDDQSYLKRIRNFIVVNPNLIIAPDSVNKMETKTFKLYWKSGPIHMAPIGYEKLAKGLLEEMSSATYSRAASTAEKAAAADPATPRGCGRGRGRARGHIDWSTKRKDWVSNDDIVAHRNYTNSRGGRGGMVRGGGGRGRGASIRGQWRGRGGLKIKGKFRYNGKPY